MSNFAEDLSMDFDADIRDEEENEEWKREHPDLFEEI